jgi:hypothetical protein
MRCVLITAAKTSFIGDGFEEEKGVSAANLFLAAMMPHFISNKNSRNLE